MRIYIIICCLTLSISFVQAGEDQGYIDLNKIEAALSPLDHLLNHDGIKRSIDLDIRFNFNSDIILKQAEIQLNMLGQALTGERLKSLHIQIVGHTDTKGAADYNRTLSKKRAVAVQKYLMTKFDIEPTRLQTLGKGEDQLLDKTPAQSAAQRRVEIIALQIPEKTVKSAPKEDKTNSGIDW
jgi:outer membrane protein OmpA-like peptidoglycan-associated protein